MTIDEAIAKYKEITNTDATCPAHCNISCDNCVKESRQLTEWLKELKRRREYDGDIIGSGALNNAYNQGYNKALNDFLKALHLQTKENEEIAKLFPPNEYDKITAFVNLDLEEIDTIAEQLKEGVTSGTDNQ